MKVEIATRTFLEQIPKDMKYALVREIGVNDMPAHLELEVHPIPVDARQEAQRKYADVKAVLSYKEWLFFRELALCEDPDGLPVSHFFGYLDSDTTNIGMLRNNVAVHMHMLRKKLRDNELPYTVTRNSGRKGQPRDAAGRYALIRK